MRSVILAALFAVLASAAHAGGCEVYRVPLTIAADAGYQIMTASGEDCRIDALRSPGFAIESNEVVLHPRYGGVRVDGTSGAYYRSNPGYRGADAFAFSLCGSAGGKTGCSTVRVKVRVR